eukprot:gene8274-17024_t
MNFVVDHLCSGDNLVICIHEEIDNALFPIIDDLMKRFPKISLLLLKQVPKHIKASSIGHRIHDVYTIKHHLKDIISANAFLLAGVKVGIYNDGSLGFATNKLLNLLSHMKDTKIYCLHDPQILFALTVRKKSSLLSHLSSSKGKELMGRVLEATSFILWAATQRIHTDKLFYLLDDPCVTSDKKTSTSPTIETYSKNVDEGGIGEDGVSVGVGVDEVSSEGEGVSEYDLADLLWTVSGTGNKNSPVPSTTTSSRDIMYTASSPPGNDTTTTSTAVYPDDHASESGPYHHQHDSGRSSRSYEEGELRGTVSGRPRRPRVSRDQMEDNRPAEDRPGPGHARSSSGGDRQRRRGAGGGGGGGVTSDDNI